MYTPGSKFCSQISSDVFSRTCQSIAFVSRSRPRCKQLLKLKRRQFASFQQSKKCDHDETQDKIFFWILPMTISTRRHVFQNSV